MARGWESKSVEAQIEEGNQRPSASPAKPTQADRQRAQEIESLRLSRARLLSQLEHASNPAYRETLMRGLRALEAQLEQLATAPGDK